VNKLAVAVETTVVLLIVTLYGKTRAFEISEHFIGFLSTFLYKCEFCENHRKVDVWQCCRMLHVASLIFLKVITRMQ